MRIVLLAFVTLFTTLGARAESDPLDLAALKGKVVYVDFWASWCAPCRDSFPWLNHIQEKHARDGLVVIGVNVDENPAQARAFLDKYPARFRIVEDPKGQLAARYQLRGMPGSYMIDRTGKVRHSHIGFNDSKRAQYAEELHQLLSEHTTP